MTRWRLFHTGAIALQEDAYAAAGVVVTAREAAIMTSPGVSEDTLGV